MEDDDLDALIINYYYAIYGIVSVSTNILLIFLVKYRSPHSLQSFRMLLINTAVNQMIVALVETFLQARLLPSDDVLALLPVGPCRHFGPMTCYVAYNVVNAANMNVAISVLHSMYFRYRLIKTSHLSTRQVQINLLISSILPLLILVSSESSV
ncbi:unnamed protein product [Cylicostephanus goldi]|uniref:G-protein coupled receptors family 1 profile domain-containing protein n=1 Tax=Cylicostephanus goldi TaxID=71465 RepID=A0A3P6RI34_CYLGO|nr:unnamed protein product [Cylicostephanus goldi]